MNKVSEVSAQVKRNEAEYNRIWNAALEEAARLCDDNVLSDKCAVEIRKLKK